MRCSCAAGALTELTSLDLSDNQLTGSLPAGLARPALVAVHLRNNLLTGEHSQPSHECQLPAETLKSLASLQMLRLQLLGADCRQLLLHAGVVSSGHC